MQLKTSRIAFAIEDTDGQHYSPPRVVVTLTIDDALAGAPPITDLRLLAPEAAATQPRRARQRFIMTAPSLGDEQIHIVPCKDCVRLLWVDRAGGVLESVVCTPGALAEAVGGLLQWSKRTEALWSERVD